MKRMVLDIPDDFQRSDKETKSFLAAKLYENGDLTIGQAADLAGYTKQPLWSYWEITAFQFLSLVLKTWKMI